MQLHIMDSGGGLLEVPYICCHCGGRSDDLKSLEMHMKTKHAEKPDDKLKDDKKIDDAMDHMLEMSELVEVEIKEEPEFLLPLDLSKKVAEPPEDNTWIKEEPCDDEPIVEQSGNHVWIKEEHCDEPDHEPIDDSFDPLSTQSIRPEEFPRIRVVNETFLNAHLPNSHTLPINVNTPILALGNYFPCSGISIPTVFPTPPRPILNPARVLNTLQVPRPLIKVPGPKPRMPSHFPAAPVLLEVPYICYHCGGRSPDLDTLKTHIDTMHDPLLLLQQKQADEEKKKILASILDNKVAAIEARRKYKLMAIEEKKAKKELKEKKRREKMSRVSKKTPQNETIPKMKIIQEKKIKKERIQKDKDIELAKRPFQCTFCPFRAVNFRGLILHSKAIHHKDRVKKMLQQDPPGKKRNGRNPSQKTLLCLFCDYRSNQPNHLKKHMYAIHGKQKRLDCPYCPHKSAYNMKWHILSHHKFKCSHCDFKSISKEELTFHEDYCCINVKKKVVTSRRKQVFKSDNDTLEKKTEERVSKKENTIKCIDSKYENREEVSLSTNEEGKTLTTNGESSGPSTSDVLSPEADHDLLEIKHETLDSGIKSENK